MLEDLIILQDLFQQVRDEYKGYFNSTEGAVFWQNDAVIATTDPFDPY